MGSPRRNLTIRTIVGAAVLAAATACPPPAPPAPEFPDGIGVSWLRDVAGAPDENGNYEESFGRFTLLDGVRTGPTPVVPDRLPLVPTTGAAFVGFGARLLPDGTAQYPWNGFAGEGVTTSITTGTESVSYETTGPTGTCTIVDQPLGQPTYRTYVISPSPDGTKLAVYRQQRGPDAGTFDSLMSVVATDGCTPITSAYYHRDLGGDTDTGEWIATPLAVWSPSSSSILFTIARPAPRPDERLVRLDAAVGSTPQIVLYPSDSTVVPLGWSEDDRLLVVTQSEGPTPEATQRRIVTLPATGGATKLIDGWVNTAPMTQPATHYGYFVPGTTTIVYSDASRTAVNAQGQTVAWPRFRLYDDATDGWAPLEGSDSPLVWHATPLGDRPNIELLDRFVR